MDDSAYNQHGQKTHLGYPICHIRLVRDAVYDGCTGGHEDEFAAFGDEWDSGLEKQERTQNLRNPPDQRFNFLRSRNQFQAEFQDMLNPH